jgi:hypothetical protein
MPPATFEKNELEVLLQIITRYTEQMVTVAENLKRVAELQEKANARLYNGMSKEISTSVIETVKECNRGRETEHKELAILLGKINTQLSGMSEVVKAAATEALDGSVISKDFNISKWLVGIVTALVVIVVAVVKVIDARQPAPMPQKLVVATQDIMGK